MGGKMTMNYARIKDADINTLACDGFTLTTSTDTTSITVVTAMTSTSSTQILFTTQTIYFSYGCIANLSTVTSTEVVLD